MSWPGGEIVFPGLEPDYEFVRLIGRGATGWVALVRHVPLHRLEAVKTIRAGSRLLPAVRRLEREARVLGKLNHPGIVTVYRLLTSPTSVAMIMEYVPGGDLQQAIDQGQLSGSERIAVLSQVADALTAAAAAGVVHRDVKPSNVLLTTGGRALLADFGLARLPGDPAAFRTMSGSVTGTPLFMAPEQINDPDRESASVDSYAFGVLAYKLLLGQWPYPATNVADVIAAHRTMAPTPPSEYSRQLPRKAGAAFVAALAKNPDARMSPDALMRRLRQTSNRDWDAMVGIVSRREISPNSNIERDADLTRPVGDRVRPMGDVPKRDNDGLATDAGGGLATGAETGGIAAGPGAGLRTGADAGAATGADDSVAYAGGGMWTGDDDSLSNDPAGHETISAPNVPTPIRRPVAADVHEVWVQPPIYVVPRSKRPLAIALVGLLIAAMLGVAIVILFVEL